MHFIRRDLLEIWNYINRTFKFAIRQNCIAAYSYVYKVLNTELKYICGAVVVPS